MLPSAETIARLDSRFRKPLTRLLPASILTKLYSFGRSGFVSRLARDEPIPVSVPPALSREVWGIAFRSPIFNAAGMFKNAEAYRTMYLQGAGAFLAGTTTCRPRVGNQLNGIKHPFLPYPASGAASNWLGLPNRGHRAVAAEIAKFERFAGFPIGVSISATPGLERSEQISGIVDGIKAYRDAGVDFIELNESCPNTEAGDSGVGEIEYRLATIANELERLAIGRKRVPIIVKFSTDLAIADVPEVLALALKYCYAGTNLGNTSVRYAELREAIDAAEQRCFDFFTTAFGGGVSGRPLKQRSLALIAEAHTWASRNANGPEFRLVRVGGVEHPGDVRESISHGAALVQWYTGYFEAFSKVGHAVYADMYRGVLA